ncbi:MAG: iron chelate uptake ABC transporter family permease subunit [Alkalibacterium sp.]|nr:iron chelate uptake ABC transporter family permease subunit [Alkalibacterium sp.]
MAASVLSGRALDVFSLGEDLATSLGQSVSKVKFLSWSLAVLLSAVTVSVVGAIGFIGLMAPHIVRLIGIKGHKALVSHSFLWGSVLLVSADVAARVIQPQPGNPGGGHDGIDRWPLAYVSGLPYSQHSKEEKKSGGTKNLFLSNGFFPDY